jgi:hypothetical protein
MIPELRWKLLSMSKRKFVWIVGVWTFGVPMFFIMTARDIFISPGPHPLTTPLAVLAISAYLVICLTLGVTSALFTWPIWRKTQDRLLRDYNERNPNGPLVQ